MSFAIDPEDWAEIRKQCPEREIAAKLIPMIDACLLADDPSEAMEGEDRGSLLFRLLWNRNAEAYAKLQETRSKNRARLRKHRKPPKGEAIPSDTPVEIPLDAPIVAHAEVAAGIRAEPNAAAVPVATRAASPVGDQCPRVVEVCGAEDRTAPDPEPVPDYRQPVSDGEMMMFASHIGVPEEYAVKFKQLMAMQNWAWINRLGRMVKVGRGNFKTVLGTFYRMEMENGRYRNGNRKDRNAKYIEADLASEILLSSGSDRRNP